MGANAQTTVPSFTIGQVLTADQQNQSARTGVPVFATTVERDAAFGGSGEKTLAEGQLAYLEDSDIVQYYDGSGWATLAPQTPVAPGLELVSTTTIGTTVSSVTVSGAFSSTYDNYLILVGGGVASAENALNLKFGATTTNYYYSLEVRGWTNGTFTDAGANVSSLISVGYGGANSLHAVINVNSPNLAKVTVVTSSAVRATSTQTGGNYRGLLNDSTQYTAFTLTTSSGTMTGGTVKVYGYKN